jgi:hypothetical protein
MTPHGCVDGAIQPLQCAHVAKGRQVHSLGMLPSCTALTQTQLKSLSIILRKVRCVTPWCCTSLLCAQGASDHTHVSLFSLPIACPLRSLARLIPKSDQRVCALNGCHGRPYNLPLSKLLSSPAIIVDLHGSFAPIFGSHHHSMIVVSSTFFVKENFL